MICSRRELVTPLSLKEFAAVTFFVVLETTGCGVQLSLPPTYFEIESICKTDKSYIDTISSSSGFVHF